MPLNINLQQILLHWLNLAILSGGLYFLLYSPIKTFMDKREAHYRSMEEEAREKTAQAETLRAQCQARLDSLEEELQHQRSEAQAELQQRVKEQLAEAQAQAGQILSSAHAAAAREREQLLRAANQEVASMAASAVEKLLSQDPAGKADPYDLFLHLAEGGDTHAQE